MKFWFSLAGLALFLAAGPSPALDLAIRHGRLIDGTGNPAFFADIGIEHGRIVAVGKLTNNADKVIDASGLVMAPGFIDVHTHAEDILERPTAKNFLRMGVTTLMLGNCGDSATNVDEFLRNAEQTRISANIGTLVGHGSIRELAMGGSFDRVPTAAEMQTMKSLVGQAMRDGAFGLSTGLIYLPGTFAKTDELIALARVAADYDGIYTSHMRSESSEIDAALRELIQVARDAQIRAEVSHIKLSGGKPNWGKADQILATIERARAEGADITQDIYVYTASSTGLAQLIPETWREGGKLPEHLQNERTRQEIVNEMKQTLKKRSYKDYDYVMIASYKADPSLNGLRIPGAAKRVFGHSSLDDQINLVLTIQTHGGATAVFHGISEQDMQHFLRHPNTMIASDSGVREWQSGVPHPRGYGNNARLLGRYVYELRLLRLEDAIRKMTSLPASTFRIRDRGIVRPGAWADLVIFDPTLVRERCTFEDPHHYATGFSWVLVNGEIVVKDDTHTGARPGMTLRHSF